MKSLELSTEIDFIKLKMPHPTKLGDFLTALGERFPGEFTVNAASSFILSEFGEHPKWLRGNHVRADAIRPEHFAYFYEALNSAGYLNELPKKEGERARYEVNRIALKNYEDQIHQFMELVYPDW
ncbi:MAG TPA: hypothetical protein VI564_00180 [Candidatus Nanoarchaeia archaeon]|nr:hypothetical protein [Candidatus Nanoarchaeia archaeon]